MSLKIVWAIEGYSSSRLAVLHSTNCCCGWFHFHLKNKTKKTFFISISKGTTLDTPQASHNCTRLIHRWLTTTENKPHTICVNQNLSIFVAVGLPTALLRFDFLLFSLIIFNRKLNEVMTTSRAHDFISANTLSLVWPDILLPLAVIRLTQSINAFYSDFDRTGHRSISIAQLTG